MSLAIVRAFLRRNPLPDHCILFVTERCNSRCATCFFWRSLNVGNELSLAELEKVACSIGRLTWLDLSGGEPFLRRDLAELCRLFHVHTRFSYLNVPTNGLLPKAVEQETAAILAACPGAQITVAVSLDGFKETHDRTRGVPGSWERAHETIEALNGLRPRYRNLVVAVCSIVMQENAATMPDLLDYVQGLDVDMHSLNILRGDPRDKACRPPTHEQYAEIAPKFIEKLAYYYRKRLHFPAWKAWLAVRLQRALQARHIGVLARTAVSDTCVAPNRCAVIYADGGVAVCELLQPLGNLRDYDFDFRQLWLAPDIAAEREILARAKCLCTHACFQGKNMQFKPRRLLRALGR
jgi:MoaA/NifB/PqqE/SkfB family radical SAM enzyme